MPMNPIYGFFYRNSEGYATCLQCSKTVSASKGNTSNLISHFFHIHKSFYDSYKSSISNKKINFTNHQFTLKQKQKPFQTKNKKKLIDIT